MKVASEILPEIKPDNLGDGIPHPLLYDGVSGSLKLLLHLGGNTVTASGMDLIPDGPFLLASTHRGFKDVPALGVAFKDSGRRIQFMAKESLFFGPVGWLLKSCGTLPINRDEPTQEQLDGAFSVLQENDSPILCIFPEGTVKEGDRVTRIKRSFALMAGVAGVPIVVAAVAGSEQNPRSFFPSDNMHIHINGVIDRPKELIRYSVGDNLQKLGLENKEYLVHTSRLVRGMMEAALAEARKLHK